MTDSDFQHDPAYQRTLVAKFKGGEVWIADGQFIVLGLPLNEEDDNSPDAHNCDALGCGTDHVIYREVIPTAKEMGALYDQKVDEFNRGIAAGSTCYWCHESSKHALDSAKTRHFLTCESSPLVVKNKALLALLARAHGAITRCERTSQGREAAKVLDEIDAALDAAEGEK